jgi:hypothetical protein
MQSTHEVSYLLEVKIRIANELHNIKLGDTVVSMKYFKMCLLNSYLRDKINNFWFYRVS